MIFGMICWLIRHVAGSPPSAPFALGRSGVQDCQRGFQKRWNELSFRTRGLIIVGATFEGLLKIAALIDLVRRPADEVRGSKAKWATAIVVLNSAGALPLFYFARGRRQSAPLGGP